MFFGSSGTTGFGGPIVPAWKNTEEAHTAYRRVVSEYHSARGHLAEIADDFGKSVTGHFNKLRRVASDRVRAMADADGNLTIGVFGGLDANGKLEMRKCGLYSDHRTRLFGHL